MNSTIFRTGDQRAGSDEDAAPTDAPWSMLRSASALHWLRRGVRLECAIGDIACQPDIDVVVNAANARLLPGGGVSAAIHRIAGPGLEAECRDLAPMRTGQAVMTSAHGLPNRFVIHCLGPDYVQDRPAAGLLASCYRNALYLADQRKTRSIAFPAISTGAFGYPMAEAAGVTARAVLDEMALMQSVRRVRFVLHDDIIADFFAGAFQLEIERRESG